MWIRAASLSGFTELLHELGIAPEPVLRAAGLDIEALARPDDLVPVRAYRLALRQAARASNIGHFGLMLSQRQSVSKLGVVGYLAQHAPNLEVAIRLLSRHIRTHDGGSLTDLEVHDGLAFWTLRLTDAEGDLGIQQTELAIGLVSRFIRSALSEAWTPSAVYFEHPAPASLRPFEAVFRCPIHFDQTLTALEFPAAQLAQSLNWSDPGLFRILQDHAEQVDRLREGSFIAQVRRAIYANLDQGRFGIEDAAEWLGLKRHSLQRQLRQDSTSFQALLDDVRFEIARHHLREQQTPISEITGILGYAETAVFTRAFRRQSGMSPGAWRRRHLAGSATLR